MRSSISSPLPLSSSSIPSRSDPLFFTLLPIIPSHVKGAIGLLDMQEGSPLLPRSADHQPQPSRYELQKHRDWNTFGQYLSNQSPPVALSRCNYSHVLEFMRYLDQFGKTKVHQQGCPYFGQPEPPGPCTCPLKQAWGSLDALIGRLRAAYEENGGLPETNPFANSEIRVHLREVRYSQARARGIPYKKKKRKSSIKASSSTSSGGTATSADGSPIPLVLILEKSRDQGASEL